MSPQLFPKHGYEVKISPVGNPSRSWKASRQQSGKTDWIDGSRCPALAASVVKLKKLEPMTVLLPSDQVGQMLDGTTYTLSARGYFTSGSTQTEMVLSGNQDTPIAVWVESTMEALRDCWQRAEPG